MISQWDSGIFKIEIEFDTFLYKLAQEEQQEMHETSALFQTRLHRNKQKIHEFQPLPLSQILSPNSPNHSPSHSPLPTPRSIHDSTLTSDHYPPLTNSIKSQKKRQIHSRNPPNPKTQKFSTLQQDNTFIIYDSKISTVKTLNEAPLKLPIKPVQKTRGGWLCMGLNFCMGQPAYFSPIEQQDDGSDLMMGEK